MEVSITFRPLYPPPPRFPLDRVGLRAGLDALTQPGIEPQLLSHPARSSVDIPTELPWLNLWLHDIENYGCSRVVKQPLLQEIKLRGALPPLPMRLMVQSWAFGHVILCVFHRKDQLSVQNRVLPQKLTVAKLADNFPAFYWIPRFITVFTKSKTKILIPPLTPYALVILSSDAI
jgi:hypothetical protein